MNQTERIPYTGKITSEFLGKALAAFSDYRGQKTELEARVRENNIWYKSQYWRIQTPKGDTEPATAFIFNAIENKYSEAVDNFPDPILTERCEEDERVAKLLSKILPLQLEMCNFKSCYKVNWRKKLKHGTAIYGVFYDEEKEDIDICAIDILNIYCDMNIPDIQKSPFVFITSIVANDQLKEEYPRYKKLFEGDAQVKNYDGSHTVKDRTEVVDCYYKKRENGKEVLHLMKLVGDNIIDASEDRPELSEGIYAHGLYPVVFDTLYPEDDSPFGIGIVDIIKNPQIYIDKLDGIISKNALIAGKIRYMIKDNGGINEQEICDYSQDVIHVAGSVDESNIRQFQAQGLDDFIIEHRQNKIDELKEIIGNRDFQQGSTAHNVTAAAAISALQQSGQKLSRAVIDDSYDAYRRVIMMVIELMREFFNEQRVYRVCDEEGNKSFERFSSDMLYHKREYDSLGFDISDGSRRAEFDVSVTPKRQNPFTKEANNQAIMALWQTGLLRPENFEVAQIVIRELHFDGKERMLSQIQTLKDELEKKGEFFNVSEQQKGNEPKTIQSVPYGGRMAGGN